MQEKFIAKTGENGKWLPLSQHLKDTADIMQYLCDKYVTSSMSAASGFSQEEFRALCVFCAAVHDIGKATPAFQGKISAFAVKQRDSLKRCGFSVVPPDDKTKNSPHALAGAAILNYCLGVAESVCEIIAAHHGKPRRSGKETKFSYQFRRYTSNYYTEEDEKAYRMVWEEIYEKAVAYAGITTLPEKYLPVQAQMVMTGLVVMADWIASNEEYFPLFEENITEPDTERLQLAKERLHLPAAWEPSYAQLDDEIFKTRFEFIPNIIQRNTMSAASNLDGPGIMIIEAPMGMGKTEAALAAAEILGYAAGSGGVFFGLPTQGTANGIFPRIIDWAKHVSKGNMAVSIGLAHGGAKENPLFASYKARIDDEDGLQINAWMLGRHRALLPDFVTGTIDQALMAALRRKFVMLLHLGLAGKTIIIDEVHSYDIYMSVFMNVLLAWLGSYKVPVILLSATLTGKKREELLNAYCGRKVKLKSNAYPLISYANNSVESCIEIAKEEISAKKIEIQHIRQEEIKALIGENLQDGGCAGIIIDTVGGAQTVWGKLKSAFPDWTVLLLHSRFLTADRTEIENHILELVGKHSENRNRIIVVGTQVLEQSLDLDFDMIITDPCPVDLLFQRLGRLHRHKKHDKYRPGKMKAARCYILNDEAVYRRASMPYSSYILRRTDEVLAGKKFLNIPVDIRWMTDRVYDLDSGSDGEDKEKYMEDLREMENQAEQWCISCPADDGCRFKGMLDGSVNGEGSVRYGINNMEFILLKDADDAFETFSGERIPKSSGLTLRQITEITHQSISMRYDEKMYQAIESIKKEIHVNWMRESVFLDSAFVIVDQRGETVIGKNKFSYSKEYGWRKEL